MIKRAENTETYHKIVLPEKVFKESDLQQTIASAQEIFNQIAFFFNEPPIRDIAIDCPHYRHNVYNPQVQIKKTFEKLNQTQDILNKARLINKILIIFITLEIWEEISNEYFIVDPEYFLVLDLKPLEEKIKRMNNNLGLEEETINIEMYRQFYTDKTKDDVMRLLNMN